MRRSVSGLRQGERVTRKKGGSSDFTSHRHYVQGDEFRSIDWNIYGRLGELYLKEFALEEALPVKIVVDTSRSMGPKFDYARQLGAALAVVAGKESPTAALDELERLEIGSPFTIPPVSRGLLIVLSDLWDEDVQKRLLGVRAETAIIHVLSPEEVRPTIEGKVRLTDVETGETRVRFVGDEERTEYGRLLAEHCAAWKRWSFEHSKNYLRCVSDVPIEEVALVYLREAGVLE